MKSAIITGSTGLVGEAVCKELSKNNIQLLMLGRANLSREKIKAKFGSNSNYISLNMKDIYKLNDLIKEINFNYKNDCIFYNFAWEGERSLADGGFENQLKNSIFATEALKIAKKIGCSKFINCGSFQETVAEDILNTKSNKIITQENYTIAKIVSRDMCKILAYLEKIDYIHTRLSIPIDLTLKKGGYISSVIKKIINKSNFEKPTNKNYFDFVALEDVANAYLQIGLKGKNKADYYIGNAKPLKLDEFFQYIHDYLYRKTSCKNPFNSYAETFKIDEIKKDTGFVPLISLEKMIERFSKK